VAFREAPQPIEADRRRPRTYCNPMNLDYGYSPSAPGVVIAGMRSAVTPHRATADPVIVLFQGNYFLFSTTQRGYWWSEDLAAWRFVPRSFLAPGDHASYDLCAPAVWEMDGALYVIGSTHTTDFRIWKSRDPRVDDWSVAVDGFQVGAWDPAFLLDDDDKLYLYYGSSHRFPIRGCEIDRATLQPMGEPVDLIHADGDHHGWERFGEHNDDTFLSSFVEGAWMTKHGGRYYLQYAAPGTEFSGYADGVYVGERPLGPFDYQAHNPFSYKPGGFARGAGQGCTFQDKSGNWWHVATIALSVKNNFERRLGLWPAGFDADGVLHTDTAYGDYPTWLPGEEPTRAPSRFTGWMLLNYKKPVHVSSALSGHQANNAVDEDIRTYWSAHTGDEGEWLESDFGAISTIRAVQINYADQDAEFTGKSFGVWHRYRLLGSLDGARWDTMVDKSANETDVPHEYVELASPVRARFVRIENVGMPTGKFALSGLRVFGHGDGPAPRPVTGFQALRGASDNRNAWLKWCMSDDAIGYVIRCGIAPDKLYTSIMVYGANEYWFKAMDRERTYYFEIEAFNEGGVSERSAAVESEVA
jgi:xylan 1,4-beta-xylosidase